MYRLVDNDAFLFYRACTRLMTYLAAKNMHSLRHVRRDDEIADNGSLSPTYSDYRRLKDLSRQARYEIPNFSEDNKNLLANYRLERIKGHFSRYVYSLARIHRASRVRKGALPAFTSFPSRTSSPVARSCAGSR